MITRPTFLLSGRHSTIEVMVILLYSVNTSKLGPKLKACSKFMKSYRMR